MPAPCGFAGPDGGPFAALEGFHALKHAVRFGAEVLDGVAIDPDAALGLARDLAPDIEDRLMTLLRPVAAETLRRLSPRPVETGVLAIARRPVVDVNAILKEAAGPVVLLERPAHLGNVGAVIRVAAAAGAAAVLTTGRNDPWHPAALRGSAGLHFALPVTRIDGLPVTDRPLIAIDPAGEPLRPELLPPDAVLAFGSERRGLSQALLDRADRRLAIPMRAGVSSLNLATAVAVVLYARRTTSAPA